MNPKHHHALSGLKKTALVLLLTLGLGACGAGKRSRLTQWSSGESVSWARFNPCACLAADDLITSIELRPLGSDQTDHPPASTEPWERVVLRKPLSPEEAELFNELRQNRETPIKLTVYVSSSEAESLESHMFRVARLISSPPSPTEPPQTTEPPQATEPPSSEETGAPNSVDTTQP